jgi:hypothetical protein
MARLDEIREAVQGRMKELFAPRRVYDELPHANTNDFLLLCEQVQRLDAQVQRLREAVFGPPEDGER